MSTLEPLMSARGARAVRKRQRANGSSGVERENSRHDRAWDIVKKSPMIPQGITTLNAASPYSLGILAGGRGRRWGGRDKGLLCLDGTPLIDHVIRHRSSAAAEVLVCCRANARLYQHYADTVLCDVQPDQGPCHGIVALLSAAAQTSLLVLPTDLVGNPKAVLETLEAAWRPEDQALMLTDPEGRHSACLRISTDQLGASCDFIDRGGKKLIDLMEQLEARRVSVSAEWLRDADTPEQFAMPAAEPRA